MIESSIRAFPKAFLCLASVFVGCTPSVRGQTPVSPSNSPQVRIIRTMEPKGFRESDRDRLSGGLPQKVPFRMATDSQGRILITEPFLSLIQVFDIEAGKRFQLKGERIQRMAFPTYIAVDGEDNIYVSEPMSAAVLVFSPDGRFLNSIAGNELTLPFGVAVDKVNHCLYVVDHERGAIQVYSLDGIFLRSIGSRGSGAGELSHPTEIVLKDGTLYVLDAGNFRFQTFDLEGNSKSILAFGFDKLPIAFALDNSGRWYCVDQHSLGVLVLDPAGHRLAEFGVRLQYGQPNAADRLPTYTSVASREDGAILALRGNLVIDVLKLETAVAPEESGAKANVN